MAIDIVLVILALAALVGIVWMVVKKLPVVRLIDTEQIKKIKQDQVILNVAQARLKRQMDWLKKRAVNLMRPLTSQVGQWRQKLKDKIATVEVDLKQKLVRTTEGTKSVDELLLNIGDLNKVEDWDKAESLLLEVLRQSPRELRAYESLGRLYLSKNDYEAAQEIYNYLIHHHPQAPEYYLGLAHALLGAGQLEKARDAFLDAVHFTNPGSSQIHLELAGVYKDLGQIADSWEQVDKARQLEPGNPRILDFFIEVSIVNQRPMDAQSALDSLRQVNPENKKISQFDRSIRELVEKLKPKKRLSTNHQVMGIKLGKKSHKDKSESLEIDNLE